MTTARVRMTRTAAVLPAAILPGLSAAGVAALALTLTLALLTLTARATTAATRAGASARGRARAPMQHATSQLNGFGASVRVRLETGHDLPGDLALDQFFDGRQEAVFIDANK